MPCVIPALGSAPFKRHPHGDYPCGLYGLKIDVCFIELLYGLKIDVCFVELLYGLKIDVYFIELLYGS